MTMLQAKYNSTKISAFGGDSCRPATTTTRDGRYAQAEKVVEVDLELGHMKGAWHATYHIPHRIMSPGRSEANSVVLRLTQVHLQ